MRLCVCACLFVHLFQPVFRLNDHTELLQKNFSCVGMLCDMHQHHHTQPVAMNSSYSPISLFLYLFLSPIDSPPTTPLLPHPTIAYFPPSSPPPSTVSPSRTLHPPSHTPFTFLPTNLLYTPSPHSSITFLSSHPHHLNTSFQTPPHTPVTLLPLISLSLNSTCCFLHFV